MANLTDFKGSFTSLARPNLFRVEGLGADRTMEFMCKASSIPEMTLGKIEVPFMVRKINIPGDRAFDTWTVTILNDEEYKLRTFFEKWMNDIAAADSPFSGLADVESVKQDGQVSQLANDGSIVATYNMVGCFPITISPQELNGEEVDAISEVEDPNFDISSVFTDSVAAVSVGIVDGQPVLDLDYPEDSQADVDMNTVMTGSGNIIEVQGTAERDVFSRDQLNEQLDLAEIGIAQLTKLQRETLGDRWPMDTSSKS